MKRSQELKPHQGNIDLMVRPEQIAPSLVAGLVAGLLEIVLAVSFAVLIFSGELAEFVANGIGLFLLATIISLIIVTLFTSLPGTVGGLQDVPAAILAIAAVSLASQLSTRATSQEIYVTVVATVSITALLTGLFFWGLGHFKLGSLVRFLPYSVIGGFLAGTGWLLATGAISTMTNQPLDLSLFQPELLVRWLPGLLFAVSLMIVLKYIDHAMIIPGMIVGGTLLFFAAAFLLNQSSQLLSAGGWLLGPFPEGNLWQPISLADLNQVRWQAIGGQAVNVAAVILMSAVALLLNGTGLEIATRREMNLNHELKVAGIANILSSFAGGSVGFHQLGVSMMGYRMGISNRLMGLFTAVICLAALFFGASLLALFPRVVLGGLLLFLGLAFLKEWIVDAWSTLPKLDYAVVILILLVTAVVGFLEAVGVGLVTAVFLFVINYSRIDVVRHELSAATQQSRVTRPPHQQTLLRRQGERVYILRLQGFVFFGTADNLVNRVRQRLENAELPAAQTIILDFRRVTGIDSTATLSFNKLQQLAETNGNTLIFTELAPQIEQQLKKDGFDENGRHQIFPDLDRALAWCEEQILADLDVARDDTSRLAEQLHRILPSGDKINALLPYLERLELPEGHMLMQQGEPPDSLYFIESGQITAQLERPGQPPVRLQTMRGGHVVGEIGFYLHQTRSAAVITDQPSIVYRLSQETVDKMEQEAPEIASFLHQLIIRLLAARVTHLVDAVNALQR